MNRRNLLKSLISLTSLGLVSSQTKAAQTQEAFMLQTSPMAGYQYYQGDAVWTKLQVGSSLHLKVESSNKYDTDAVEVYWQDSHNGEFVKLGYLPRKQNYAVSQLLQNQKKLTAKIMQLTDSNDPWERVALAVFMQG